MTYPRLCICMRRSASAPYLLLYLPMILQCEKCQTRFLVNPAAIGSEGRQVRCANCAHEWMQLPPKEEPPPDVLSPDPVLRPIPRGSGLPVPLPEDTPLGLKLAAVALALVAIGYSLWLSRPLVTGILPATQTLYDIAGQTRSDGVVFTDLTYTRIAGERRDRYAVDGTFINTTEELRYIPTLRVSLVNSAGDLLQYWDYVHEAGIIEPGQTLPFHAERLDIRFKDAAKFIVEIGNAHELAERE